MSSRADSWKEAITAQITAPQLTLEEIAADVPRFKEGDIAYFAARMYNIKLTEKQLEYADSCINNYWTIACFARQSGKSVMLSIVVVWFLLFKKGVKLGVYAPSKDTAMDVMYTNIKKFLFHQRALEGEIAMHWNSGKILMIDGNIVKVFTANDKGNVRGFDATILLVDEAPEISNKKFYTEILPSISARQGITADGRDVEVESHIWIAGTIKGRNHYYDAIKSALPKGGWSAKGAYVVMQPWNHPGNFVSDPEKIAYAEMNMPAAEFAQEYMCVPNLDTGFVFKWDNIILACNGNDQKEFPRKNNAIYIGGIDLGMNKDHCVLVVFRYRALGNGIGGYQMVFYKQWDLHLDWTDTLYEMGEILIHWKPEATYVDAMNVGDMAYGTFFKRLPVYVVPFKAGSSVKKELVRNMQMLLEKGRLQLWDENKIKDEMEQFEEGRTALGTPIFSARKGKHDDIVMAMGMGLLAGKKMHLDDGQGEIQEMMSGNEESKMMKFLGASKNDGISVGGSSDGLNSIFDSPIWER